MTSNTNIDVNLYNEIKIAFFIKLKQHISCFINLMKKYFNNKQRKDINEDKIEVNEVKDKGNTDTTPNNNKSHAIEERSEKNNKEDTENLFPLELKFISKLFEYDSKDTGFISLFEIEYLLKYILLVNNRETKYIIFFSLLIYYNIEVIEKSELDNNENNNISEENDHINNTGFIYYDNKEAFFIKAFFQKLKSKLINIRKKNHDENKFSKICYIPLQTFIELKFDYYYEYFDEKEDKKNKEKNENKKNSNTDNQDKNNPDNLSLNINNNMNYLIEKLFSSTNTNYSFNNIKKKSDTLFELFLKIKDKINLLDSDKSFTEIFKANIIFILDISNKIKLTPIINSGEFILQVHSLLGLDQELKDEDIELITNTLAVFNKGMSYFDMIEITIIYDLVNDDNNINLLYEYIEDTIVKFNEGYINLNSNKKTYKTKTYEYEDKLTNNNRLKELKGFNEQSILNKEGNKNNYFINNNSKFITSLLKSSDDSTNFKIGVYEINELLLIVCYAILDKNNNLNNINNKNIGNTDNTKNNSDRLDTTLNKFFFLIQNKLYLYNINHNKEVIKEMINSDSCLISLYSQVNSKLELENFYYKDNITNTSNSSNVKNIENKLSYIISLEEFIDLLLKYNLITKEDYNSKISMKLNSIISNNKVNIREKVNINLGRVVDLIEKIQKYYFQ